MKRVFLRFRPNIVIKGGGAPFVEDSITELAITPYSGPADRAASAIYLVSKCTRCLVRVLLFDRLERHLTYCG